MTESLWLWWHRRHGEVSSATGLKTGEYSHVCKGCYSVLYRFSREAQGNA